MYRSIGLAFAVSLVGRAAASGQCSIDPSKDFFENFDNSCYAIPFASSSGGSLAGDSNARYGLDYFKVNPGYELIVYGAYPQARYFSVAVNDDHDALTSSFYDQQIQPLTAVDTNPYATGATFVAGQRYAVTVSLGGVEPPPGNIQPGCSVSAYNIHGNTLPGNVRHTGINWNGDPNLPRNFPPHIGTPPLAGTIMVRQYVPATVQPTRLLVRDLTTGCAVPASTAINTLQVVTSDPQTGGSWNDQNQVLAHEKYAQSIEPTLCWEADPANVLLWTRNPDYIPGINPNAAYLRADVTSSVKRKMGGLLSDTVLRIRLRLPTTPITPCAGCSLSGTEQQRYWSVSFMNGAKTIVSLSDEDVVKDQNGYVTLIVSIGGKQPANATAANGYTYINISTFAEAQLTAINIRYILPSASFNCSAGNIPFFTSQDNPLGGYMGDYGPVTDLISGASLPAPAVPDIRPDTCTAEPSGRPQNCSVYYPSLAGGLTLPLP